MDLKMEVYSPFLELLGLLEIQNSVMWENKAFSSGSFTLNSLITEESKTLLVPENIIWIAGDDAGSIEYVQQEAGENGPYITVKGCDLTGLLARRILWGRYDMSGPVPEIMYRLVDDCCIHPTRGEAEARKIPGLVLAGTAPTGGESIRIQKTGGYLLDALEEFGTAYGVPFGVRFNPTVPQMEFWARYGVDRSIHQNTVEPVFYSTELDDVLSSEYSYNAQNYRNVALVAGEGEGKDRVMVTVNGGTEPTPEPPTPPTPTRYTITLSVDPEGGGIASGGGQISEGQSVTVTAAPSAGYTFSGWRENGEIVSTSSSYTFTVSADRSLTAVFAVALPVYTVTASIDPEGSGTVTGAGTYEEGKTVTLKADPGEDYKFAAWTENGKTVSESAEYTFPASADRALVAVFEAVPQYTAGVNWWEATLPETANWSNIAYGDGKFVAIASNSNKAAYSLDGIDWTMTTLPNATYWQDVCYGGDRFVAISSSNNYGAYSLDGITWTAMTLPNQSSANWYRIAYGGGIFFVIPNGNVLRGCYSSDGRTWATVTMRSTGTGWSSLAYGADKFVAISKSGQLIAYSTNGTSWKLVNTPSTGSWTDISYGAGKFVSINYNSNKAIYSLDGISWAEAVLPTSANWFKIAYGDEKFVTVAYNSNKAAYSEDGINWTEVTLPSSGNWQCLACGDGKFVALAYGSNKIVYSSAKGSGV